MIGVMMITKLSLETLFWFYAGSRKRNRDRDENMEVKIQLHPYMNFPFLFKGLLGLFSSVSKEKNWRDSILIS